MKLIVCLDDKKGMMFNHRRLSQDEEIRKDIYKHHHSLIMNEYSYQMFLKDQLCIDIIVSEDLPLESDIYQFIEDKQLKPYEHKIDTLIVYYWNRRYPSDFQLDIDFNTEQWNLIFEKDIIGKSHDKITKKIYQRGKV